MRILVAADSLGLPRPHRINNYSPNETDLAIYYENTYSSIINKELLNYYKMDPYIEVINRSRRFQTIKNVNDEFADHLFFYEPDVIMMHVGIVDCWFRENLEGKQMVDRKNYQQYFLNILELLKNRPSCKLVIVGIAPTSIKMQKRYPGINREIRLYNQVLKSSVDNKTVFYIDMEKHVDPHRTQKYLLPDDSHLNQEGNKLVAEQAISLFKGFIYADLGVQQYNEGNHEGALKYFERSYDAYPLELNNIYNLMVIYFGNQQMDKLNRLIGYVKIHEIDDMDILNIVEVVEAGENLTEG